MSGRFVDRLSVRLLAAMLAVALFGIVLAAWIVGNQTTNAIEEEAARTRAVGEEIVTRLDQHLDGADSLDGLGDVARELQSYMTPGSLWFRTVGC